MRNIKMKGKSKKKKIIQKTVSIVDIGCSNCRKPNLSSFFNPFPKKPSLPSFNYRHCHSSASSSSSSASSFAAAAAAPTTTTTTTTTSSSSPFYKTPATPTAAAAAVAVEKDSDDPYLDFRQSMLQMILENQIYTKDDLRELLHCFLSLNAPYHHGIIIRAFTEIWEGVFSSSAAARPAVASPLVSGYTPRASRDHSHYFYNHY